MQNTYWLTWGVIATAAALAGGTANAQERARVLQSIPVVQQIGIPQQVCGEEPVYRGQQTSGAGAVIGAVIGGVAGNALGSGGHRGHHGRHYGSNRGVTTAIGAVAGGLIGNQVEGATGGNPAYETVRRCTQETVYEDRTVGYDVTYEYAGRRYTTRMERDPGRWMPVQVQPTGTYSSAPSHYDSSFSGPSGEYRSAPPGVTVTESITYDAPPPSMPIVVDVNVGHPYYQGYPGHPGNPGYPPPPPPHWQPQPRPY